MPKSRTPSYTIEGELSFSARKLNEALGIKDREHWVQPGTPEYLEKLGRIGIQIYNDILNEAVKRKDKLIADKDYQNVCKELSSLLKKNDNALSKEEKARKKELKDKLNSIKDFYGYSDYALQAYSKKPRDYFKDMFGSDEAQKLATRAFNATEKVRNGKAEKVRFKSQNDDFSFEGKSGNSPVRYKSEGYIQIGKNHKYFLKFHNNDKYIQEALKDRVKYVRIISKTIRGKKRYFAQLIMEGYPPRKKNRIYGSPDVKVGLDEGTSTIGIVSKEEVSLVELAPDTAADEKEIRRLNRAIERSKRALNPENYNENGTIKKGRHKWKLSKRCRKLMAKRKELYRRSAERRRIAHNILANHIIAVGTDIRIEDMNYKALQKKSSHTAVNKKNGKNLSKKRYGKTIMSRAPAMLISIIDRKLSYEGLQIKKVNTSSVKASQYDHITDTYKKKPLGQRYAEAGSDIVQRDLYSAFLIMNTNDSLDKIDRDSCTETYDNFKKLQDEEVERIRDFGSKTLKWYVSYKEKPCKEVSLQSE